MRFLALFLLIVSHVHGVEICFPTQKHASHYQAIWQQKTKGLLYKLMYQRKITTPVQIQNSEKCDNCLMLTGDEYIIGILQEEFEEKRKEFEKLVEEKPIPPDYKVDVSMGTLYPDEKSGDNVFFNKLYRPFLRHPGSMQNAFYDREGTPIFVSAELRNPEIIIYSFIYKDMKHKIITKVDDPVGCMFPYDEETRKKYPLLFPFDGRFDFYMKEEDKNLLIKNFHIMSIKRDFYWPQEKEQKP